MALNIVCFRYVSGGIPEEALNEANHRTRREDFALLVKEVVNAGNNFTKSGK